MDSIDFERLEKRARIKYEWGRLRRAVVGFAPALVVVVIAASITPRPVSTLVFGAAMFVAGVGLLWYGRDLQRAVLPGVVAGAVPLVVALCANQVGHLCTGGSCVSLCLPACTGGGAVAGIAIALFGHQRREGLGYCAAASCIALLTGAMGCSCIGYSGLIGLGAGYGVGLLSGMRSRSSA